MLQSSKGFVKEMLSYRSLPTHSQGGEDSLSPSGSSFDDDVFSNAMFKQHPDCRKRTLGSLVSVTESAVEDESLDAHDNGAVRVDAVANDNSVARHGNGTHVKRETTRRFVFKNGACNVSAGNILQRKKRYLVDTFTTLINMKWRYNVIMFGVAFMGSWSVFGVFWWLVAVAHGDHHHPNSTTWEPCVTGVYDFLTAFLFSVETQHTIGYGSRVIEPHCAHGVLLLMVQACCGIFIQSLMTGLIFAKLSRPKHRANTMMFSRQAVICLRDGVYCLLFRVGDMRSRHLVDTSIRALIVMERRTEEGETIPLSQSSFTIEMENNCKAGFVFLAWPMTFVHRIVPGSPLYSLSAEKLPLTDFEIIVILEGVIESTGYYIQIRTSYTPSEVLWGHRLAPLVTYANCNGRYEIDFKQFHNVLPIASMPIFSAKEYDDMSAEQNYSRDDYPFSFTAHGGCRPSHRTSLMRLITRRWRSKTASRGESLAGKTPSPVAAPRTRKLERQWSADVCSKMRHPVVLRKSMSH